MRDISQKNDSLRTAVAKAILRVSPATIQLIKDQKIPKGDPLSCAKVAAIQAAKNTSQIIPLCHPIPVAFVGVEFQLDEDAIEIVTTVKAIYKTGVEMEALTAASVAALTIYDMTKMLDEVMQIESVRLESKTGGKSDRQVKNEGANYRAAVIVMSDTVAAGKAEDVSGHLIRKRLEKEGFDIVEYKVLPDDESEIIAAIRKHSDDGGADLIITTGGTGIGPRDTTPDAIKRLLDKELPGVTEQIRNYGQVRTPFSMLSRSLAGVRNKTVILCLPGSAGGVQDSMDAIFPAIKHSFKMLAGGNHAQRETSKTTKTEG
ncbi:MAG: bifunctional molybdenum cofactor biosynthesis protein MoaC/MoaB [Candidatus Obscuribacterales bacterium]|nr:bifunctional molybdenum cofactor biosynthesis protein MoaC/MoaB [Cyanobacteria bacterium SZAS LIN-5]RTL39734.1 MAG: bifunctional molybdenum cofactor biosynthesis protein MoaC/MoaB [Candidatus Melainabacteria bacterium]